MAHVTVREALERWSKRPTPSADPIDMPAYELVAMTLFDIANTPSSKVRGSMVRATKAQRIILNRLVGTRRPGSHPAARTNDAIEFVDLTMGELER